MSARTAGSLVILALAAAWGVISILVREVPLPALALVFWRVALASAAMMAWAVASGARQVLRPPSARMVALGALLAAHWACYFASIRNTSVASANLVTYANPILVALIAPVLIRERITRVTVGALAASLAGIALIAGFGPSGGSGAVHGRGVALAAAAAATYALLIVLLKLWGHGEDPLRVVLWQSAVAALVLAPAAAIAGYGGMGAREWLYVVLLGVVLTGVSGLVYVSALRLVPATSAGILAYMEPVSAAVLAVLLLGEAMTWAIVAGGALIVAAGIAIVLRGGESVPPIEEPAVAAAGLESAPTRT